MTICNEAAPPVFSYHHFLLENRSHPSLRLRNSACHEEETNSSRKLFGLESLVRVFGIYCTFIVLQRPTCLAILIAP